MAAAPYQVPSYQTSATITHFSHSCPLTLSNINLPNPPCSACNVSGGLAYTCGKCNYILHTTCSLLPLEVAHQTHQHKHSLTFVAPYPGNTFSCAICKTNGSNTWIYRCNLCGFDAHLSCVTNILPPPVTTTIHHDQNSQASTTTDRSAEFMHTNSQNYYYNVGTNTYGQPVAMAQGWQYQQQQQPIVVPQGGLYQQQQQPVVVPKGGQYLQQQPVVVPQGGQLQQQSGVVPQGGQYLQQQPVAVPPKNKKSRILNKIMNGVAVGASVAIGSVLGLDVMDELGLSHDGVEEEEDICGK